MGAGGRRVGRWGRGAGGVEGQVRVEGAGEGGGSR